MNEKGASPRQRTPNGNAAIFILVAAMLAMLAAASCTPTDPGAAKNPKARLDQATLAAIQTQITSDPRMAGANIRVAGERDSIVLTGTVLSDEQRGVAEELAKAYDSELAVRNDLQISSSAPDDPDALPGY